MKIIIENSQEFKKLITFSKENNLPCKKFLFKYGEEDGEEISIEILGDHIFIENKLSGFQDGFHLLTGDSCYIGLEATFNWLKKNFRKVTSEDKKKRILKKVLGRNQKNEK